MKTRVGARTAPAFVRAGCIVLSFDYRDYGVYGEKFAEVTDIEVRWLQATLASAVR
ncbi:MAG: hypothetical protein ACO3ND_07040 [Opitutales bacterium]